MRISNENSNGLPSSTKIIRHEHGDGISQQAPRKTLSAEKSLGQKNEPKSFNSADLSCNGGRALFFLEYDNSFPKISA